HARTDHYVLAQIAAAAQLRSGHDVRKVPDLRAVANFARLINHRRRMYEIACRPSLHFGRRALVPQRTLAGFQYFEDAKRTYAIGSRTLSGSHALEEMLAFEPQWFVSGNRHRMATIFLGNRLSVEPVNPMRIQHEFAVGAHVVENRHFLAANNREFLLLERMEPADKNMGFDAAREIESAERRVHKRRSQKTSPLRGHARRALAQEEQDCGDIVGSKTPKDVFLGAQFAQIQPRRMNVLNAAQFARADQAFEFADCRVKLQNVADLQDAAARRCQFNQFAAVNGTQRQGLFDENVFPSQ